MPGFDPPTATPVTALAMNTMRLLRLTTLGPIFGLFVLAVLAFFNQRAVNRAQINRYESFRLAQELRASSEDLTRLARTYVVTGDPVYEEQYWHLLDVRNGVKPRADGRTVPLRTLMQAQGFSVEEFAKLKEAENNSNALVTTETIAMNAVKGQFDDGRGGYTRRGPPDPELARRIMHDQKYHADKAIIMGPIAEFETLLDRRTEALAAAGRRRGEFVMSIGVLLASASGATAARCRPPSENWLPRPNTWRWAPPRSPPPAAIWPRGPRSRWSPSRRSPYRHGKWAAWPPAAPTTRRP